MVPTDEPELVSEFTAVGALPSRVTSPSEAGSSSFASPKSSSLACPDLIMKIFAGLISRCRIPLRCAASSASASCVPISTSFG